MPAMAKLQQFITELDSAKQANMKYAQFQVQRNMFLKNRLVEMPEEEQKLDQGEILVKIEKFAYTSNNISYATYGDVLGYWKFFPPFGKEIAGWGVIPVWGFAQVVESKTEGVAVGERLFGYFPPAHYLKMKPASIKRVDLLKLLPIGPNYLWDTIFIDLSIRTRPMTLHLTGSVCCYIPCIIPPSVYGMR